MHHMSSLFITASGSALGFELATLLRVSMHAGVTWYRVLERLRLVEKADGSLPQASEGWGGCVVKHQVDVVVGRQRSQDGGRERF